MVDTKTVLAELCTIKRAISNVVQMTGYAEYGDMSEVCIECETEDFSSVMNLITSSTNWQICKLALNT